MDHENTISPRGSDAAPPGDTSKPAKATGPRTKLGKQRSRYNALKHGIFSQVLLLDGESKRKYLLLVAGLRAAWQPQGTWEDSLVENLAALQWRKRRFLEAERAEISKAHEFAWPDWNISCRSSQKELWHKLVKARVEGLVDEGLLHEWTNPFVLADCVSVLKMVREHLEHKGFGPENERLLILIYGGLGEFFLAFSQLSQEAQSASSGSVDGTNSVYEEKRAAALKLLAAEIEKLKRERFRFIDLELRRLKYVKQTASVPPPEVSERLVRYEAHLSREIDRTLRQLEHSQARRLGQPVPPSIQVEVSG